MWETRTGYCPVHQKEVTVEVQVSYGSVIGDKHPQSKVSGDRCDVWNPSRKECSNCPIAYGFSETP